MKTVYRKAVGMSHYQFATRVDPTKGHESLEFSFLPELRVFKAACGCWSFYVAWLLWQYSYQFSCGHVQKQMAEMEAAAGTKYRLVPVEPDPPSPD